jgi:hypothetical protein
MYIIAVLKAPTLCWQADLDQLDLATWFLPFGVKILDFAFTGWFQHVINLIIEDGA